MCLLLVQDGNTPLHTAAKYDWAHVIDVLLKSKAAADCRNKVQGNKWKINTVMSLNCGIGGEVAISVG